MDKFAVYAVMTQWQKLHISQGLNKIRCIHSDEPMAKVTHKSRIKQTNREYRSSRFTLFGDEDDPSSRDFVIVGGHLTEEEILTFLTKIRFISKEDNVKPIDIYHCYAILNDIDDDDYFDDILVIKRELKTASTTIGTPFDIQVTGFELNIED
jgi:hypothetical protein